MDKDKKIVVLAGDNNQFRQWIERNIIVITNKSDIPKIFGKMIHEIHEVGTYYKAIDARMVSLIFDQMERNKN